MLRRKSIQFQTWELALVLGLAIATLTTSWTGYQQRELASHVLRLHVLANSDTQADQELKLSVRDAVLEQANGYLA